MKKLNYEMILENYNGHQLVKAEVRYGNEPILVTDGYIDFDKAKIAAEYFISGIRHALEFKKEMFTKEDK